MNLARKIHNLFHPIVGEIWCLHRVVPERSPFPSNRDLEITPDYLEQLITDCIKHGYNFVDTDTFVKKATHCRLSQRLINITFDDGFSDIFTHAYPILKRHGIPFTIYVTTDMPDGCADLWWLQLEQLAGGNVEWFNQTIKEIYNRDNDIAATMHSITSSSPDPSLCQQHSLSWEQLHTMLSEGLCTIGSHGVSHSALSLLSETQILHELQNSRKRIKEMLGVDARHFSYPHSFYNETTNRLVWQVGYRTAVIGYGGKTRYRPDNRLFYRNYIVQP